MRAIIPNPVIINPDMRLIQSSPFSVNLVENKPALKLKRNHQTAEPKNTPSTINKAPNPPPCPDRPNPE